MDDTTDKNSFEATKILISLLDPPDRTKRGRPDKKEIAKAVKEIAQEESSLADDHKRIFA